MTRLDWVVIDEAHTYRGVFGSNVANVIRRLRRICAAYGSTPRFLLASATIANPVELAERLVGEEFCPITEGGAPAPEREVVVWNPPLIDRATGTRRSSIAEAADLLADLVAFEIRTICFMKSRRGVELIRKFAAEKLVAKGRPELAEDLLRIEHHMSAHSCVGLVNGGRELRVVVVVHRLSGGLLHVAVAAVEVPQRHVLLQMLN